MFCTPFGTPVEYYGTLYHVEMFSFKDFIKKIFEFILIFIFEILLIGHELFIGGFGFIFLLKFSMKMVLRKSMQSEVFVNDRISAIFYSNGKNIWCIFFNEIANICIYNIIK